MIVVHHRSLGYPIVEVYMASTGALRCSLQGYNLYLEFGAIYPPVAGQFKCVAARKVASELRLISKCTKGTRFRNLLFALMCENALPN